MTVRPESRPALAARASLARSHETLLVAAIVAAHGTAAEGAGFGPSDVRFFFYLFSNWTERDALKVAEPLELTQVRRLLARLVRARWAREHHATRYRRYVLTPVGLAELVSIVSGVVERGTFEEVVFVITFLACYGRSVTEALARTDTKMDLRPITRKLDPLRVVDRMKARIARVLSDLDERIQSSARVATEAARLKRSGHSEQVIARRLQALGAYQLQHVRSFAEFSLAMPAELRAFELGPAVALRSQLLFVTFAEQLRAESRALDHLRARIVEAVGGAIRRPSPQ